MSTKRTPMEPPDLPGFTYVDVLGSGGFADVNGEGLTILAEQATEVVAD